ncbi:MAG TPA: VWA domain-containing protein [Terriglobales bacterium]|nr:VWA domain-containing protein [Terriglobales bacterium]
MSSPRILRLTALNLVLLSVLAAGQDAPSQSITLKTSTDFVQIPVIVQRSGKHLGGLTKNDFVLRQDGKDQPIATFEEVRGTTANTPASSGDQFKSDQTPQQLAIIAVDSVNTAPMDQEYFKQELIKYFAESKSTSEPIGIMLVTRGGIRVLHDFTTDRKSLLATAQSLNVSVMAKNNEPSPLLKEQINELMGANGALSETETKLLNNSEIMDAREELMSRFQDMTARIDSLGTLQQIAQALKGVPGRKTLLWAGSGFPFMSGAVAVGPAGRQISPERMGETVDQHAYTWKLLNDANVAVYPIDTRRTVNTAFQVMDTSLKYSPSAQDKERARENDTEVLNTFKSIAAETGGKPCIYRTDLRNCLKEATEDDHEYYLLGFYVDRSRSSPGWHKVGVSVTQKASVRHRAGFLIALTDPEKVRQSDIALALNSPYAYTSLHFTGRFSSATENGKTKAVPFQLQIPPDAITIEGDQINFDIVAVARALGGKEAARLGQRIQRKLKPDALTEIRANGINYRNKMDLPPGDYGVWFVLRDNPTGRTGSVTVPVKLP